MRLLLVVAIGYVGFCVVLLLLRNRMVFPIRGGGIVPPARVGIADGELVEIAVDGGDTLKGWLLPGGAPVLVWFHGNGETVLGIAPILREFRVDRVALLAVDYRGYGGSTGSPTVANTERDALAVYDWIKTRPDLDAARVVVYGRSVGSGPAVALASQRPVTGLILESPFTSLGAMARQAFPFIPTFLMRFGFDNLARIGDVKAPLLVIHGDRDSLIPTRMGHVLYEHVNEAGGTAAEWIIPGAEHNTTFDAGGEEYVRRVKEFVERCVR